MAHKTGMMGNQRNFGMQGGPGKGDNDRTSDRKTYNENFDAINWKPKTKKKKSTP